MRAHTRARPTMTMGLVFATLVMLAVPATPAAADEIGVVAGSVETAAYGTFDGIEYVMHMGRFVGTAAGEYSVGFEIVAPKDPSEGNGCIVVEVPHILGGANARETYFGPEFLFGQGFSHASIGWHPDTVNPFEGYSMEEAIEIIANFAQSLKEDSALQDLVGDVDKFFSVGNSLTTGPLLSLIRSPQGVSVFDLWFLIVVSGWDGGIFEPPPGTGLVMLLQTEADQVRAAMEGASTAGLRGMSESLRVYEVAGAPHVSDVPRMRDLAVGLGIPMPEFTTPIDWGPMARALLSAGHLWATEGMEPPPSVYIDSAPEGEVDPVYKSMYDLAVVSGVARDADGNAKGGIRPPDLAVGRGKYIAVDPDSYGLMLGAFVDLKCEPGPDGTFRFSDHASYVEAYAKEAERLVAEGYLLAPDAVRMVAAAGASQVGAAGACPVSTRSDAEVAPEDIKVLVQGATLNSANGLAVGPDGLLYIASALGHEIVVMDPDTGEVLETLGSGKHVSVPDDLGFRPDGSLYWTNLFEGTVVRLSPDGSVQSQMIGPGVNPIAFSDDGRLFVGRTFMGSGLYEVDPEFVDEPRLILEGQFNGMDWAPDGYLYVPYQDGGVLRVNVDDGTATEIVDEGGTLEFGADGLLYYQARDRIVQVDVETGEAGTVSRLTPTMDNLAFDSANRMFVSDFGNGTIYEVLADGRPRVLSPGGMIVPGGIAVVERADGGESVYVADLFTLREYDGRTGKPMRDVLGWSADDVIATPATVSADAGDLILTSWFANAVQVYDPVSIRVVDGYSDFRTPVNAIRFQGELVVSELGTGSVVLAPSDDPSAGSRVTLVDGLGVPAGLAATDDDLYVCDMATGAVLQAVRDGERLSEPIQVASGLQGPEGLAVDQDGSLLVVEARAGRLSRIDLETGGIKTVASGLELGIKAPPNAPPTWMFNGVAVGESGAIYVTADDASVVYNLPPTMQRRSTEEVFAHHRKAIETGDFPGLIADYSEDAVIITADGVATGKDEITGFFGQAFGQYPNLQVSFDQLVVAGDSALLLWSGDSDTATITQGVATFLIQDGYIQRQTEWWVAEPVK